MNKPVIDEFIAALVADRKHFFGKATESWRHRSVLAENRLCVYCDLPVEHRKALEDDIEAKMLHIEHFIPRKIGGPHEQLNLVSSCASCKLRKGNKDWLACPLAPSKQAKAAFADRRTKMMETCQNHLLRTRETAKTKPYVLTLLRERWVHPRFTIRAALTEDVGLFGFGDTDYVPDEIVVQLLLLGANSAGRTGWVFVIAPARFHDLVWQLIEQNAWVRQLDLGSAYPDPTPPDDSISRWHETFSSVGDIHRRRGKPPWIHPKDRPAWHEKPMDPRTRLHLAGLLTLKTGQSIDREWLARHRNADEDYVGQRRRRFDQSWLTRHDGCSGISGYR